MKLILLKLTLYYFEIETNVNYIIYIIFNDINNNFTTFKDKIKRIKANDFLVE